VTRRVQNLLAKPVFVSLLTSVTLQGFNVVTGVILARGLGPVGRGQLAAAMIWPTMLAIIGSLGVYDALTYYSSKPANPVGTLLGTGLGLGLLQTVVLVPAGLLIIPQVLKSQGEETVKASLLYLTYIPLIIVSSQAISILGGLRRFGSYQFLRVLFYVVSAAGLAAVAMWGRLTVAAAVAVYLVANCVMTVTSALILSRHASPLRMSRACGREFIGFGLRGHTGTVFSLLNERLDQLIMSVVLPPAELGVYVVAVTMSALTSMVGNSIGIISFPSVSSLSSLEDKRAAVRHFFQVTLFVSIVLTIPVIVALEYLISFFFGRQFLPAAAPGRILLLGAVALSLGRVASTLLKGLGHPSKAGIGDAIGLGVTLVLLVALMPRLHLMGAATASLVAYSASALWMMSRVNRIVQLSFLDLVRPDGLKFLSWRVLLGSARRDHEL